MFIPPTSIERTLRTLLRSANPYATDLLVAAIESPSEPMRVGAVRAIALRSDARGHRVLVERFAGLAPDARSALTGVDPRAPLLTSLIAQIDPTTPRRAKRAIEVALAWRAIGVLPAVVDAAQWPNDNAPHFAEAALRLSRELELALQEEEQRRPGDGPRSGEDPAFPRRATVNALALALDRFNQHGRGELIEAMLLLTPHDEPALVRALLDPKHSAHQPLLEDLRTSTSRGAVAVLAGVLADPSAPKELLDLVTGRCDVAILGPVLSRLGLPIGSRARHNAERIESFAWLEPERLPRLLDLTGDQQAVAIQLVAASKANRRTLASAIGLLLDRGEESSRRAACRAIDHLPNHLAHEPLALALAIDSPDPAVTAVAAGLLRKKDFPQATGVLVRMLDNNHEAVRHSAQQGLRDLSFSLFREHFDSLSPEARRRAGVLVGKADPFAAPSLASELRSGVSGRRLRAIEMIELMGLVEPLIDNLVEASTDHDVGVRNEAVRVLGDAEASPEVLGALSEALKDRSSAVRATAGASLEKLDPAGAKRALVASIEGGF